MASILLHFPPPPRRSHFSVFEQDGQMTDAPDNLPITSPPNFPEIQVDGDALSRATPHRESAQMAFLSHGEGSWKHAVYAWQSGGVLEMLQELSNSQENVPSLVSSACKYVATSLKVLLAFKDAIYPSGSPSTSELLSKYTQVTKWERSPILALAWHPHIAKVAVALPDSSVRVHSALSSLSPVLKHRLQRQVADLAWQPLSSSVLAVACHSCVLIWHVEPTSLAVRPSSSCVQVLHYHHHSPVTRLSWTPGGDCLASASPCHSSIVVWDVPKEEGIALKCGRDGVPLMCYSPDGSRLFTGALSPNFRMWETQRSKWEVWSDLSGRCKAACWSPDSSVLIFSVEGDSALYAVRVSTGEGEGSELSAVGTSVLLADLAQISVSVGAEADIRAGGEIHSVVWDKTGERLAVMFEPNEVGNNPLVAVFKVTIRPVLELLPSGFVKGKSGESAHHISFASNFDKGALLTVVWSSGRVGYLPMYFIPSSKIQSIGASCFSPSRTPFMHR